MFTKQIPDLIRRLRGVLPERAVNAFEDTLGGCDQSLEHRAPILVDIDGDDRVNGQVDRYRLPEVCFVEDEPIAAITASNPAGQFSGENCVSDCVSGGLAFRAIGPSALDKTRITTLYVGSLLDLCGNPFPTGSGSELVRFRVTDALPDPGDVTVCLARSLVWDGVDYVLSGTEFVVADFTTNTEMSARWQLDYEGWAAVKADRPNLTIGPTTYTVYECVWVEAKTRFIEFSLNADLVAGSAEAQVLNGWGSDDNADQPTTTTVYDRLNKITGATTGFTGFAVFDETAGVSGQGQYIVVASSGSSAPDALFRFELQEDMTFAATSARALLLDQTLSTIAGDVTAVDSVGEWQGKTGYQGWCVRKADNSMVDSREAYEIVFMEGQARFIPFTLSEDVSSGSADALIGIAWGRTDNGRTPLGTITVHDPHDLFRRAKDGAKGVAVWNDQSNQYVILECETQAGAIAGTMTGATIGASSVSVSRTDFWGTQQDHMDPGGTIPVEVRSGIFDHKECPDGGECIATYDEEDGKYVMVEAEHIADAVEFTLGTAPAASIAAGHAMGGIPPVDANITTSDHSGLFTRALPEAKGIALYHNDGAGTTWAIVNCQSKAGEWAFATSDYYSAGSTLAQGDTYWGTQQDIQSPIGTQSVVDSHGLFNLSRTNARGYAVYDNELDKYRAVYQETYAHLIITSAANDYTSTDTYYLANIDEHHMGQSPSDGQVQIRNIMGGSGSLNDKGMALLDTINSTPAAPQYIGIPAGGDTMETKARWGRCLTSWYRGGNCDEIAIEQVGSCAGGMGTVDTDDPQYNPAFDLGAGGSVPGISLKLPRIGGSDPNLIADDIVAYMKTTSGEYVCISDYSDDAIGTAKMWVGSQGSPPRGWKIMNGSGDSGIDMTDRFPRGGAAGSTGGNAVLGSAELRHHHVLASTAKATISTFIGEGDPTEILLKYGGCMEDKQPYDEKLRDSEGNEVGTAPDDCTEGWGPLNILNPYATIVFIERVDDSQDKINNP